MLDNFNEIKFKFKYQGERGLPENYPTPNVKDQLFYIQRNHNSNSIIYALNKDEKGIINSEFPIEVFWLRYGADSGKRQLNKIQRMLAFGYKSWKINTDTYKFNIVSKQNQEFILSLDDNGQYQVVTMLENQMIKVSNIYVYAEEFGVFPQVKYIEFYGQRISDNFPTYYKEIL